MSIGTAYKILISFSKLGIEDLRVSIVYMAHIITEWPNIDFVD